MKYLKWSTESVSGFWNVTVEIIFDVTKEPLVGDLSLEIEGITTFSYKNISPNFTKGSSQFLNQKLIKNTYNNLIC